MKNHSINLYNDYKRKLCIPYESIDNMQFEELSFYKTVDNNYEKLDDLDDVIKKLPTIYRNVITLKFVNELSNKEIAQTLNISEVALRKRIERAKRELKAILEKENSNIL